MKICFFKNELIEVLINHPAKNAVLNNKKIKVPEKYIKAIIQNDAIKKIGVNLSGDNIFLCANL